MVPYYVGGEAVGTVWVVMHDQRRKFDAEDERLPTGPASHDLSAPHSSFLFSIAALLFSR